jgi:hypothetical protein
LHLRGRNSREFFFLCFQQPQQEEVKAEETKQESSGDSPAEVEVTTPTEATPASPNTATSPDNKETKKKDKVRRLASALADPGLINRAPRQINKFSSSYISKRVGVVAPASRFCTSI